MFPKFATPVISTLNVKYIVFLLLISTLSSPVHAFTERTIFHCALGNSVELHSSLMPDGTLFESVTINENLVLGRVACDELHSIGNVDPSERCFKKFDVAFRLTGDSRGLIKSSKNGLSSFDVCWQASTIQ